MRLQYEKALTRVVRPPHAKSTLTPYDSSQNVNFIDSYLFQQMAQDGVTPAGPATDAEFLRRITLDITGQIPSAQQVLNYTASTDPNKESALIETLLASSQYVDQWTLWFNNTFQVTSDYYNFIGIPGRTLFNSTLRSFVASNGSYQDFVTLLITATGDSHQNGAANFIMRGLQYSQPMQDSFDELTNYVTADFLGIQTTCISCHNGRGHLDVARINLYLSQKTRVQFWQQSAFFSGMNVLREADDASGSIEKGVITDFPSVGYNSVLADPNNPGPRPPRTGGPYTPVYLFSGTPASSNSEEWRQNLASMVVNDRQFARAFVDRLWAFFFRVGIVDPPNSFDPSRLDPANPPPAPWVLQPSNAPLLEALTDAFIQNGYQIRPMIRLLVQSRAYHLSSVYPGQWTPLAALDYAKSLPRRLSAEEIYDAVVTATNTPVPMTVEGIPFTIYYAGQLPDPTEPRSEGINPITDSNLDSFNYIRDFLSAFGRGDWNLIPRDNTSNPVLALTFMNSETVTPRTFGNELNFADSLVAQVAGSNMSKSDAITLLCLSTLGRPPTDAEMATALAYPAPDANRQHLFGDIHWAFLNETEFFFNH